MVERVERAYRLVTALVTIAGGISCLALPTVAPSAIFVGLVLSARPLIHAWRASVGTALRAAVIWASLTLILALLAEANAWLEPLASGRSATGHWAYLSSLAALAALVAVLGARTPGVGAWTILMGLLLLVFLIPWLEGPGLARGPNPLSRLRLDQPWALFYALLVLAGVTNYITTRYGPAVAWLGLGFILEYVALTRLDLTASTRAALWSAVPWTFSAAIVTAQWRSRSIPLARNRLEAIWLWFRDHWGVVWALRVQERFNRAAETQKWPIRLTWHGLVSTGDAPEVVLDAAETTLKTLLRRFVEPARIDAAVAGARG